ncbi:MAG: asparagine--tRNA ligase [Anaerolineae bacterium]|jgi:asparaginyl-tRNA synthetase|nr:asparagine--tRNA ligase [Anaerolineae bacterium]MDH7474740.1 asparagine--tRNA ligase [Anaerolineae bacterium]
MPTDIRIENIADYVGQEVTIKGWLYNRTDKGRLQFLQVRDGTGIVQVVAFQKEVAPEVFADIGRLTQESSLIVTGIVRADERAPGVPGGYELSLTGLQIVQIAEEYPITLKEHGIEFLMEHRHLWIRSSRQWAILRIRATIIKAIRDWFDNHGFILMDTPILTPAACEGTTTLFATDYFGTPAYLSQSGQLYNEANIMAFGKVYCFGPTFRAEKSKTRRHIMEFWMVEPEMAYVDLNGCMEVGEQLVSYIVQQVLEKRGPELQLIERDTSKLERIVPPFPRISYDQAVEMINELGHDQGVSIEWGDDFGAPQETLLSEHFEKPVFVHHYPTAVKAFYMAQEPDRPETCKSVDLLAPEGYGEIIGGGERSPDIEFLEEQIRRHNLPRAAYEWYLDLRRYGSVPHSGFGLGVERTVAWICGLHHIRETIPFPRLLGRIYP